MAVGGGGSKGIGSLQAQTGRNGKVKYYATVQIQNQKHTEMGTKTGMEGKMYEGMGIRSTRFRKQVVSPAPPPPPTSPPNYADTNSI